MAASRDSAPLSLDSFRTWRVATTCSSTPPHAINTSTHQHIDASTQPSSLLSRATWDLVHKRLHHLGCCAAYSRRSKHRVAPLAVAPSRGTGTSHPLPGDRQLPIIESRQWLQTLSYLPGGSAWAQGQRCLLSPRSFCWTAKPVSLGVSFGPRRRGRLPSTHSFISCCVVANHLARRPLF